MPLRKPPERKAATCPSWCGCCCASAIPTCPRNDGKQLPAPNPPEDFALRLDYRHFDDLPAMLNTLPAWIVAGRQRSAPLCGLRVKLARLAEPQGAVLPHPCRHHVFL